ncbi:tetratricopeptide repeat (TPR)-like superfamily protein [Actinidia rufa]|uniref:Tetratricopeptide repeat (TPR)-like superfamily protein n=1 Tax=Actinidia rufa TaxID=165716 RepID=A0A7J0G5R6_9ERIC|nr:tetratricopeptide repeat (TPR)-like superfamily protein [Actinidia rufa]
MILKASTCESVLSRASSLGKQVHAQVVKSDVVAGDVLYTYMNQVCVEEAEVIFNRTVEKDVVVYNAMTEAIPNCKKTATKAIETQNFVDIKIGSALIDMYAKCGRIEEARRVFDRIPRRNVFSWTSMIDGSGKNGNPEEALTLFIMAKGQEIFNSMERDYSMKPKMENYACIVDLLGCAGSLNQAWEFVMAMQEMPNSDVWASLLSACRLHGDVEMVNIAANEIFKLNKNSRLGGILSSTSGCL